jgi:hypothetical protein
MNFWEVRYRYLINVEKNFLCPIMSDIKKNKFNVDFQNINLP